MKWFAVLLLLSGVALFSINLYGLTQDIRPEGIENVDFRFKNDLTLPFEQAIQEVKRSDDEDELSYATRLSETISKSLAHIHWKEEPDIDRYHQRIPIWENYFLYFLSYFTPVPEFERYHYTDYRRSLERGIGICGDASMIMSQLLDEQGIPNQLVSFPGHVILEATMSDGEKIVFDPDFGLTIPFSIHELNQSPGSSAPYYLEEGYTKRAVGGLVRAYGMGFERWDGVTHFMTKKYYFEKVAYWLKWPVPVLLIITGLIIFRRKKG